MRIRNRIKRMVAVENRYYNREGAISFLIGVSVALICFNLVFAIFYYYGNEQTDSNLQFLRYSAYLLIVYLLFLIAYRFAIRYLGYRYPLITGFTAITFLADAGMAYLLFRTVFCWNLNRLIENPLGFEPILRRSFSSAFQFSLLFLLAIVAYSFIPAKRQRPQFFGRFFFLNTAAPLLVIPAVILVVAFIPEAVRVEYTRQIATAIFFLLLALFIRYLYKTALYFVLLIDERKITVEPAKTTARPTTSPVAGDDSELPAKKALPIAEIVVDEGTVTGESRAIRVTDGMHPAVGSRQETAISEKDTQAATPAGTSELNTPASPSRLSTLGLKKKGYDKRVRSAFKGKAFSKSKDAAVVSNENEKKDGKASIPEPKSNPAEEAAPQPPVSLETATDAADSAAT